MLDADNMRRRFRASNYLSAGRTSVFASSMPLPLSAGWNHVQFNLGDFTERTYGTAYVETVRISVHANCRLRRVYFSDRLYAEDQLPDEYRLYRTVKPPKAAVAAPVKSASKKSAASKKAAGDPAEKAAVAVEPTAAVAVEVTAAATEATAVDTEPAAVDTEAVSYGHDG